MCHVFQAEGSKVHFGPSFQCEFCSPCPEPWAAVHCRKFLWAKGSKLLTRAFSLELSSASWAQCLVLPTAIFNQTQWVQFSEAVLWVVATVFHLELAASQAICCVYICILPKCFVSLWTQKCRKIQDDSFFILRFVKIFVHGTEILLLAFFASQL